MRKKLDTRFPAARIKKIMQTDEDVGKIAQAVPLLVSKALELFLQDLCDQTYEITLQRGAKTINSMHLKQCVNSFNVFDFLKDTVSKVPELGGSEATSEDRPAPKKRKTVEVEDNGSDEEPKRSKTQDGGGGRGRGRGRGRPRGSGRKKDRESTRQDLGDKDDEELADTPSKHSENDENAPEGGPCWKADPEGPTMRMTVDVANDANSESTVRNFDLNADPSENAEPETPSVAASGYPGWSAEEMEEMAIDPVHLANLNGATLDEEDEDYDEES